MNKKTSKDILYNDLEKLANGQNTIEVFIKHDKRTRGAFKNDEAELEANDNREIVDVRGKENFHLIIRSREVPNNNSDVEGLKVKLPHDIKPHHVEVRRLKAGKIEVDLHFVEKLPFNSDKTHLDPRIQHPD
jgi:ASC-1-like (ASCH) protein